MTVPNNVEVVDLHVHYEVFEDSAGGLKEIFASGSFRRQTRRIHAVRGVSFEVREGESFGIIGGNGAGKSTLLSAMTGLLPTTSGEVRVQSRPSLLGVSAALRASLSGRRNITIGCLALGMSLAEADERIDEIIEFAGLREFIDLPMRTYSSGMRARLNFAIATAVTPRILLVDEALAVGDAEFRQRSQGRIDYIREAAGSVVLVSHNLEEVRRACDRALWLEKGEVRLLGPAGDVIDAYLDDRSPAVPIRAKGHSQTSDPRPSSTASDGRALLHIGVAGADDDLIQRALASQREEMRQRDIDYMSFLGRTDHGDLARYGAPPTGLDGAGYEAWASWCENFRERFLEGTTGARGLIGSSSALGYLDEPAIERVCKLLAEAGIDQVEAVMFVRRQDEIACLIHRNRVFKGSVDPFAIDEHLANALRYDYAAMAQRWSGVVGSSNLHVRLHKDRNELGSNVDRFVDLAGLPPCDDPAFDEGSRDRPELISALRELNIRRNGAPTVPSYKFLTDRATGREEPGLSTADGEAILSQFRQSNQAVLAYVPDHEKVDSYFDVARNASEPERPHEDHDIMDVLELVSNQLERATRSLADLRSARID